MARFADADWDLKDANTGKIGTWEKVGIAVLMDIREELRTLNALLRCPNFTGMPMSLAKIAANTRKPKRRRKKIV